MCKKSLLFVLLFALMAPWAAKAQTTVEIGDGTGTTYYFPIDNYFNYSCTQQIYTADEIGTSGNITAVSFYYNYGTAYTANNVTMYMKNVDRSNFSSTTDCEALALDDIVWTGSIAPTEAGWYTFELDTPFEYDGTSNLLVAFFDGTSGYPGTSYTWRQTTSPNSAYMALRYYSDSSCPDPYNLSSYSGSKSTYTYRSNIQIEITSGSGPVCDRPATLVVSDITGYGATCTWESNVGNYTFEYKKAADSDWTVVPNLTATTYTLSSLEPMTTYNTRVKAICDAGLESGYRTANFTTKEVCPDGKICIGEGTATNYYLPAHNYYNYSLTQQIYTADEIGEAGAILSIDFFKASTYEMVKNLDIYMVSTTKDEFESTTDFIPVTASDLVFSGTVTFADNAWTTIELDNPFVYDGTSNVAIMVDNNTGGYVSSTPFYVFSSDKNQALYAQNDGTNFDPLAPAFTSRTAQKNRIRLAIGEPPACPKPTGLTVNYTGGTEATISWTSDATAWNMRVNGTPINGTITNPYTLTGLELSTTYEVEVQANCGDATSEWAGPVSFTTDACMPEDQIVVNYALTDSYGDGWNGNAILVVDESCTIVNQLTIASGASATGTLKVCGSYVQFLWYVGSYPGETSWVFTDNAGNVLFEGAGSSDMATLDVLYTIDNNPYSAPADVAASEVGPRSAKLSWTETGTATAWQIKLTAGDDEEGTIIDANSNPFVITGLTPETEYFAQVRSTGANGTSIWTCLGADFTTTEACPAPQNIVVSDVTANSALVSWLGFGESYDLRYVAMPSSKGMRSSINKKPTKLDFNCKTSFGNVRFASSNDKPAMVSGVTGVQHNRDGWYYYDNGETANNAIGTNGGNFYWGIMIPAGSYLETTLTKTSVYDELAMTGTVTIYNDGTDAPAGDALAQADVTLTGAGAFVETEFREPVTIDPSKNLWIVYYNGSGATYPAATCTAQGDANGRWVSVDGTSWMDVASAMEGCGNFMVRAYLEGAIEIDWIEVPGITASEYELTGLDPETTYLVQIRSNCGDDGQSDYAGTNFTTMGLCDNPHDLDTIEVNATSAILNWTGAQENYILRYRPAGEVDPTAPAIIILEAHDTWGDGTGYQMLLDDDATALGVEIPESGPYTGTDYSAFEYLIPENADCDSNTENLVFDGSVTLEIPAGVYDWCIINPEPGGNMWISGTGDIPGRYNDYVFEPGVTYHFTMQRFGSGDGAALEITRPMSDWTVVENVTNPYELTGLNPETYYEWQIQGVNEDCHELEWSEIQHFTTTELTNLTQTVELAAGTNWFSTYVEITLDDLKAALLQVAPTDNNLVIISQNNGQTKWNGRIWTGQLRSLDVAQMYQIQISNPCEITLEGMPIDPTQHPITIAPGANWIGFPFAESMSISNAFSTFSTRNDFIKSGDGGQANWNGRIWTGGLKNLEPGKGYKYNSVATENKTFVYPTTGNAK